MKKIIVFQLLTVVLTVLMVGCESRKETPEELLDRHVRERKEEHGLLFLSNFREALRKNSPEKVEAFTPAAARWWDEEGEGILRRAFLKSFPDRRRMAEVLEGAAPTLREMETLQRNGELEAEKRMASLVRRLEDL